MSIVNKNIAILVDNYFEQVELEEPLRRLKQAGAAVTVIGTKTKRLRAMHGGAIGHDGKRHHAASQFFQQNGQLEGDREWVYSS